MNMYSISVDKLRSVWYGFKCKMFYDIEPVLIWVVLSGIIYFHIANRPISILIKSQLGTLLALLLRTLAMGTGF